MGADDLPPPEHDPGRHQLEQQTAALREYTATYGEAQASCLRRGLDGLAEVTRFSKLTFGDMQHIDDGDPDQPPISRDFNVLQKDIILLNPHEYGEPRDSDATIVYVDQAGELQPPAAADLRKALYDLTDAGEDSAITRDDIADRIPLVQLVVREGRYLGEAVYFREIYNVNPKTGMSVMRLYILTAELGKQESLELRHPERQELADALGVSIYSDKFEAYVSDVRNKVTRLNYKEIIHVFRATRDIVDGNST